MARRLSGVTEGAAFISAQVILNDVVATILLLVRHFPDTTFIRKSQRSKKVKNSLKVSIREKTGANERKIEIMTKNLTLTDFDFL